MPGHRRVARHELGSKTMGEPSAPDPRLVLRKRLGEEMEALRGILRKAELVVRKSVDKGGAAPRGGKDGRFLAAEARSETMEGSRIPRGKKRKTMPPVDVEITEPRISKDEILSLVTRLSLLSPNIPARIVAFLNKECTTGVADEKAGENEMEIELGSMRRSAMFELHKLLDDEFSEQQEKHQQQESMNVSGSISRSSPRELEDGEFIEEDFGAINSSSSSSGSASSSGGSSGSSCSDSSDSESSNSDDECVTSNLAPAGLPVPKNGPSPIAMPAKGLCSPPRTLEDGEIVEEEEVDICSDADPVATEKFAEITESPRNISSSSSSGSSGSSGCSAGSSCSDSSDSYTSDSGSDDECVTSNLLG